MPNIEEEMLERLVAVEKTAAWLAERVWNGAGNHHERIHVLEDKNGARVHEIGNLQADVARIERVLGLNGYGDKNILNDLRSAVETINKMKSGVITNKDFQKVLEDLIKIKHELEDLQEIEGARSKWKDWAIAAFIGGGVSIFLKVLFP